MWQQTTLPFPHLTAAQVRSVWSFQANPSLWNVGGEREGVDKWQHRGGFKCPDSSAFGLIMLSSDYSTGSAQINDHTNRPIQIYANVKNDHSLLNITYESNNEYELQDFINFYVRMFLWNESWRVKKRSKVPIEGGRERVSWERTWRNHKGKN